ncbi:hypothetical protein P280DRAFT_470838 [Massarina eburnea CBS 473.64]|uniref:FAD-binding PCMH-type domain-containing protein n=1 Tax=Massarina eburnea CBS 473.64 TaxID=1395130 RepID=A0A6A6RTE9_9PLEO|nr:hypothetical protein P280DRAFT_470838 [Massarina eburnea CBS 473.64]
MKHITANGFVYQLVYLLSSGRSEQFPTQPLSHSSRTDMATLDTLKQALVQHSCATTSSTKKPLSEEQYSTGFDILVRDVGWKTYQDFIIPQLSQLLASLFSSRLSISALEIGPGPTSVLGYIPIDLGRKIKRYTAYEPNNLFATRLENGFRSGSSNTESPMHCLEKPPEIHRTSFTIQDVKIGDDNEKYDVILFCHSMYGMNPKHKIIERALSMLAENGMIVVFYRNSLHIDNLVCHKTVSFPTGITSVVDDDEMLDRFAPYIAGFTEQDKTMRGQWRNICRTLARRDPDHPNHLFFGSPEAMVVFSQHATSLPELTALVPVVKEDMAVKNREARQHRPASIIRPTQIEHVQQCVKWALKHEFGLTVIGGGHSDHCLWPNVVAVDMSAFAQVHVLPAKNEESADYESYSLVIAETGCKTGDIIAKAMDVGLTVPLGARPSVGAGLWLQGGIGHLSRSHGLTCDAVVGAVVVSVKSGQILYVGCVPEQHRPAGAIRAHNEAELLWAIKGAGTNFGIVVSVTFKACIAPRYLVRNWVLPLSDSHEAQEKLGEFDKRVARELTRNCSADAYLYWDAGKLHLGVTMYEVSITSLGPDYVSSTPTYAEAVLGKQNDAQVVDSVGMFETEMYMSGMHGGHSSGKTSSFKRCVFLMSISEINIINKLIAAIETRPSALCYLHLLHGGGAVTDVAAETTAFGCRGWDFACVITGVWPRYQDDTETARSTVQWVYKVAEDLLPFSSGAYSADLGPDPRDSTLAVKAFGPNVPRLARLKHSLDPSKVLPYSCALPKVSDGQKLIVLVTGKSCVGKDYCASIWADEIMRNTQKSRKVRVVSISDAIKREYATASSADIHRLLSNRDYKEQHRPALTDFFQQQMRERPQILEEQFQNAVQGAGDVDVLFITGMRDQSPVTTYSHLVPGSRLIEVHVQTSESTRRVRKGYDNDGNNMDISENMQTSTSPVYRPSLVYDNDGIGKEGAKIFAGTHLLPFLHEDLQRLASMVRSVPDFPRPGIQFRHILGIAQHPGGLALCTSLLRTHYTGDWAKVGAIVSCEVGSLVFAPALSSQVNVPLKLIREAGKLPPPTVSVPKPSSYISSRGTDVAEKRIGMERDAVSKGVPVVVVDDALSSGNTLCGVLKLLNEAGIASEDISVMVVAEFPVHRGRDLLRQHGFGKVDIQSLLVFGDA